MKKKTVSLLLSLAMCLTMLPGQSVFAAETCHRDRRPRQPARALATM